jgi:membrane protein DedA with SNARE-associated domain
VIFAEQDLARMVANHGYWVVAAVVGLEAMGLPLPGETVLVVAAVIAGTTGHLDISGVIAAAAMGAILGDNVGFWLGREYGYRLLLRYGPRVGMPHSRIKLGQYLFLRHGSKVVFFGRFIALFRVLAAVLAGANRMPWRRFLLANASGGIIWAATFGLGAYLLGDRVRHLSTPVGMGMLAAAAMVFVAGARLIRHHHDRLEAEAERALPGPLPTPAKGKVP